MSKKVRIRFAPSPTGLVHIGSLRTVLYNYLFAKHNQGQFILRIEDTDQKRFVPGAELDLLKTLQWAGFEADEGCYLEKDQIKSKGEYGPYRQSERLGIYKEHIKDLLKKNKAYYCFCDEQRLEKMREEQAQKKLPPRYDKCCRGLSKKESQERLDKGEKYVVRFKIPEDREVVFDDLIRGPIIVNSNDLDDFVLLKSDGYPTYHFANIVDDHLMKISHVLRGDEWIASTPKHILLYEAFGWQSPYFAHLPQLLNKDKKKLSKRQGDVSVTDFINQGYLKDALINFIALLGWNSGTEQEIYSMDELINQFDLKRVHKAGAVFDLEKLDWINGMYIRKMDADMYAQSCLPSLFDAKIIEPTKFDDNYKIVDSKEKINFEQLKSLVVLEKDRIHKFSELPDKVDYLFKEKLNYAGKLLVWKKSSRKQTLEVMELLVEYFSNIPTTDFSKEKLEEKLNQFITSNNLGVGDVLWPLRVAVSGRKNSPGPFEICSVLGKEKVLKRLEHAIDLI